MCVCLGAVRRVAKDGQRKSEAVEYESRVLVATRRGSHSPCGRKHRHCGDDLDAVFGCRSDGGAGTDEAGAKDEWEDAFHRAREVPRCRRRWLARQAYARLEKDRRRMSSESQDRSPARSRRIQDPRPKEMLSSRTAADDVDLSGVCQQELSLLDWQSAVNRALLS